MMDIVAIEDESLDVAASLSNISLPSLRRSRSRSRSPPAGGLNAEPVVIRGNGTLTVFGLNNRFSSDFPQSLIARVAPEEFRATIEKINSLLSKALPLQMKWVVLGCFCCCCTLGCSFWPVICMNKKTRLSIEKLLDWENTHLYRRLNLHWKLAQMHLDSNSMLEYVLVIDEMLGYELEVGSGIPLPPEVIRNLILNSQIQVPIVFRKIHANWNPVLWDLEKLGTVFVDKGQLLPCRVGKIHSQKPQWESQTGVKCLSWSSISNWKSTDEWIYYDYKNMVNVVDQKYFKDFEWSKLGFPERDGKVSNLWVGSAGSYTPCHFDTYGCNLVGQILGRKRWLMFPAEETKHLRPCRVPYEESSVYSQINFSRPSCSHFKELDKVQGVMVEMEPGDVLFVPPKWWHFVQSQEFSISVNTWIEMPEDAEIRVNEGIVRSLISSFVTLSSPETVVNLLNPNEEELLDVTEPQIEEILRSSASEFLKHKTQLDNHSHAAVNASVESMEPKAKKIKSGDSKGCVTLSLLESLRQYGSVKGLCLFDPNSFYHHIDYTNVKSDEDNQDNQLTLKPSYLMHLINALGHPSVVKVISKQFLENILSHHSSNKSNT